MTTLFLGLLAFMALIIGAGAVLVMFNPTDID